LVILEIGSRELFAQAGLKPLSSWSQPPTGVSHQHPALILIVVSWTWEKLPFFGGSTRVWTQGLTLLYYLSHTPNPFCFSFIFQLWSCFCPGLALDQDPPTFTSF
jgi:hypothetical protein